MTVLIEVQSFGISNSTQMFVLKKKNRNLLQENCKYWSVNTGQSFVAGIVYRLMLKRLLHTIWVKHTL